MHSALEAAIVMCRNILVYSTLPIACLQASAQSALPMAAKYSMTRPIQRYAQHVQHVLLPSMVLKDAVQWLDLFCHTCKSSEPIITALVLKCDDLVKSGSGMADAAAFLSGTADTGSGGSSGASRELHPLAATKLLGIVLKHRSEPTPAVKPEYKCAYDYCSYKSTCQYWSISMSAATYQCAPTCVSCGELMTPC